MDVILGILVAMVLWAGAEDAHAYMRSRWLRRRR